MRFGIDIDGIVANFNTAFVREVNDIWPGKLPVDYVPNDWDWSDKLTRVEVNTTWNVIEKKPNWWLSIHPYADNLRAIALQRIRHPEDEIFFVTARHQVAGMPTMHQTQVWLSECGINGLGVSVIVDGSGDKSSIFNALECDANIDDKLEAVIEHDKRTKGAFLLSRPWNERDRPASINVVGSLQDFFAKASGGYKGGM